ncbi:MAG: peptide chain release factor N(5)-glutamine methyltransferase [Stellaceae bacterium]
MIEAVGDTLGSLLEEAACAFTAAAFDDPRRQARRLVSSALGLSPTVLVSQPRRDLAAYEAACVRASLRRMLAGEPLSRIAGRREFWGLEFSLSPDTLDPRPDSESIIDAVLRHLPERDAPLRLLDLGTGTGCLLSALLCEYRAAFGVGIDVVPAAVRTARGNAQALGLDRRAQFLVGDWATALSGKFDVVVANPPYIATAAKIGLPPEVALYDPWRALDGGEDGLAAYRRIIAGLAEVLAPGGIFAGEIGIGQAEAVAALLCAAGFTIDGLEHDLAGIIRCVVARNRDDRRVESERRQKTVGMCRRPV